MQTDQQGHQATLSPPFSAPASPWAAAPERLVLENHEVHVWRAVLDVSGPALQRLRHILAPDERARADRFHFQKDQEHFVVARGALRTILGRYLQRAPELVAFRYGLRGKPELAEPSEAGEAGPLTFNVSHSHGLALYAVSVRRAVGIDVEHVRPFPSSHQIAERFFSAEEIAGLCSLPDDVQQEAFFRCWTRKEAILKAKGEGLFGWSLLPTQADAGEWSAWAIRDLEPGPGYVAAISAEGKDWTITSWEWTH